MTTETKILTREQIDSCFDGPMPSGSGKSRYDVARLIEQAVLNSPEVVAMREQNKLLLGLVKEMSENDTYETEYDGRMYSICHGCGAQDGEDHRNQRCVYLRAQAAIDAAMEAKDEF